MIQVHKTSSDLTAQAPCHTVAIGQGAGDLCLRDLIAACRAESAAFAQRQAVDGRYGHELFQRALALRQERAWEAIVDLYGCQVRRWVLRHQGYAHLDLEVDDIVYPAFARMWRALPPARMSEFTSLAGLLQFLRACIHSEIMQGLRDQTRRPRVDWVNPGEEEEEPWEELLETGDTALAPMEDRVLQAHEWDAVLRSLSDERELLVVACSYAGDLPPREIAAFNPALFGDAAQVSQVKENVLRRLRRHPNSLTRAA